MSASNWATCPRCYSGALRVAKEKRDLVMGLYGRVPVEEFDAARNQLTLPVEGDFKTFREDYEFTGAENGEVSADYEGQCTECGLSAELHATKRFWPEPG